MTKVIRVYCSSYFSIDHFFACLSAGEIVDLLGTYFINIVFETRGFGKQAKVLLNQGSTCLSVLKV